MSGLQVTWFKQGRRALGAQPVLAVEDLVVHVGARRVLDGLNLEVFNGDHVRITGPNGCGKSTLLNAIVGVAPARVERGRIRLNDTDITNWPAHERARRGIAYMRQVDHVFPVLTVGENLLLALGKDGYERFEIAFPEWAADLARHKRAGQLSGGQKKKLAWGMTILTDAEVILADEPQAGVARHFVPPAEKAYILVTHQ
jgi:ABC-type branched-subunit amino acid transport system ATPase component